MRFYCKFVTAVCVLFLIKPMAKKKSIYELADIFPTCFRMRMKLYLNVILFSSIFFSLNIETMILSKYDNLSTVRKILKPLYKQGLNFSKFHFLLIVFQFKVEWYPKTWQCS